MILKNILCIPYKIYMRVMLLIRKRQIKKRIINKDITIISDNCIAGILYKEFNVDFKSPTIGMFFCGDDFYKFCLNMEYYLSLSPEVLTISKWMGKCNYPIGRLGDLELHFLHYSSFKEAFTKWERRKVRVNLKNNNIIYLLTDRDFTKFNDIYLFDKNIKGCKVIFSAKKHDGIESLVYCSDSKNKQFVNDDIALYLNFTKYTNLIDKINNIY